MTQAVLEEFGIESVGAVMDPDPFLALGDAVRATSPDIVLLSRLYESRYGLPAATWSSGPRTTSAPGSNTSRCASTTTRSSGA